MDKNRIRMLMALIAGLVFLALTALFPNLPFTEGQTVAFFGLIAAYMIGEGLEGPRIADNFKAMLASWKFRSLVAGTVVLLTRAYLPRFPLTEEQIVKFIELLSALILGVGAQGAIATFRAK